MAPITRYLPDNLRTGDRVDVDVRGLFPVGTRLYSCGGIAHAFDHTRATHTGIVIEWQGKPFILEMTRKGIRFNAFAEEYLNQRDARIIQFARHPVYENAARRYLLEREAAAYLAKGVEYDYPGIVSYVTSRVRQDPRRFWCSELFYYLTKADVAAYGTPYPQRFEKRVSPYDLQKVGRGWEVVHAYGGVA